MARALIDYHHADLAESLHILLTDRLGIDLYIPVGREWFEQDVWRFGQGIDPTDPELLVRQFLNPQYPNPDEAHPDRTHNFVEWDEAMSTPWDYVIASVQDNYTGYYNFAASAGAKFVVQVGNANQPIPWELDPLVLNSSEAVGERPNVVTYHQPFDTDDFHFSEPKSQIVGSFVNCMDRAPCYSFLAEAIKLMPERTFRVHGIDGIDGNIKPTKDVATLMRSYGWGWHDKETGDGFGHVIHNWASIGRPLIGHAGHYAGQMAGPLWEDGVTCIDLDKHAVSELPKLLEQDNVTMGHAIRDRFEELVNFEEEAEQIRALLTGE